MTEGFEFRLQKLLDIRKDIEDKSKLEFKEAQRERNLVEEELNKLKGKYNIHRNIDSYESIVQQKMQQNYLNALNYAIDETAVSLENKKKIVEQKRSKLKQSQVDKKTVEVLRENQESAFIKEQNSIEQKTNDEFALYGFIRNNKRERR